MASWYMSPWAMLLWGALVGSFVNLVVHRLPAMLRRSWARDALGLLESEADAAERAAQGRPAARSADKLSRNSEGIPVAQVKEPITAAQALVSSLKGGLPTLAALVRHASADAQSLTLSRPHSACPSCGHVLRWYELLPVVSWLFLRGKCSACGTRISARYPLVEAGMAFAFGAIGLVFGPTWTTAAYCFFVATLITMALIDHDTMFLPDQLTQPVLWAGLLAAGAGVSLVTLQHALLGAAIGFGVLLALYWTFRLATGQEALGLGDMPLLALIGAWLGPAWLIPVLVFGGASSVLSWVVARAKGALPEGGAMAFGHHLALGALTCLGLEAAAVRGVEPVARMVAHWRHAIGM